jgi:hypothetical protein
MPDQSTKDGNVLSGQKCSPAKKFAQANKMIVTKNPTAIGQERVRRRCIFSQQFP